MGTRRFARGTVARPRHLIAVVLLACTGASFGCASRVDNPFDERRQATQVRIVVINHDFNDATLYAVGPGERRRLGVVTGKTEENYLIPWRMVGPLHIEINVLTSGSCNTETLQVEPGETLELQILDNSTTNGRCSGLRGQGG
jgi:hypothetical protein